MKVIKTSGYKIRQPIDKNKYPSKQQFGLEGPFRFDNGKILYYDSKEGLYYDSNTDMYVSHEDMKHLNNPSEIFT